MKDMAIDKMTSEQLQIIRDDFISERIAIMVWDAGMSEKQAIAQAEECWNRYRIDNKLFLNEQPKII